jgi:hypothetical protein
MEPVFQPPDFTQIADYPGHCRGRFMEALAKRKAAPYHVDKRAHEADAWAAVDDYLAWLAVYGD